MNWDTIVLIPHNVFIQFGLAFVFSRILLLCYNAVRVGGHPRYIADLECSRLYRLFDG